MVSQFSNQFNVNHVLGASFEYLIHLVLKPSSIMEDLQRKFLEGAWECGDDIT